MKENKLVDLSKQFAVDIVNLCAEIKEIPYCFNNDCEETIKIMMC